MKALQCLLLATCLAVPLPATAQFNTSAEVKPILQMIVPQWISLREFDGQDLLYFTMLEVYRCGIEQIRYVINDGKPTVWETPPCEGDATFSEIPADRLPYATFKLGAIRTLRIELTFDDGTIQTQSYERAKILQ